MSVAAIRKERDEIAKGLAEAARTYLATRDRVFRLKPMGGEGSAVRLQQNDEIEAEDNLLAALARYDAQCVEGITSRNSVSWDSGVRVER